MRGKQILAADHYQVLEIDRDASPEEIKRAFHRLAKRYHPDVASSKASEEHFKRISQSYDVLSNPDLKRHYDLRLMLSTPSTTNPIRESVNQAVQGFSDFVNDMVFGARKQSKKQERRGENVERPITLSFAEAYSGATRPIKVELPRVCPSCKGKGWPAKHPPLACFECHGQGQRAAKGPLPFKRQCKRCNGQGRVRTHTCTTCGGDSFVDRNEEVSLAIPAGVDNESEIRVAGKGQPGLEGGKNGDLIFRVQVQPSAAFTRKGADLHTSVELGMLDLLLGKKVQVNLPEGHVIMSVPARPELDHAFRLKGKGFPQEGATTRGDLYVSLHLRMPREVPDTAKPLLNQIANLIEGF